MANLKFPDEASYFPFCGQCNFGGMPHRMIRIRSDIFVQRVEVSKLIVMESM